MNVIRYETAINEFAALPLRGPTIFLAGPTVRQKQYRNLGLISWRVEALELLKQKGFSGNVFVPEFESWDNAVSLASDSIMEWEFAALNLSDCILFWIPRTEELIGLTTNFELGYWVGKDPNRVVYGRPDGAYKIGYTDFMWKKCGPQGNTPHINLNSTVSSAIFLADRRHVRLANGYPTDSFYKI